MFGGGWSACPFLGLSWIGKKQLLNSCCFVERWCFNHSSIDFLEYKLQKYYRALLLERIFSTAKRCWTFNRQKMVWDWVHCDISAGGWESFVKDEAVLSSEDASVFWRLASELPLSILKKSLHRISPSWRGVSWTPAGCHGEKGSVRGEKLCVHVHCSHVLGVQDHLIAMVTL